MTENTKTKTTAAPPPSKRDRRKERRRNAGPAPKLGGLGTLRWVWRQLTSMRTALFLLLILAVAAVPGSIFPQRNIDAARVTAYLDQHQTIGPWLDKLGFFNVFSSPWFAAVYLLLIISLIGCIVPRTKVHLKNLRAPVPRLPKRLERLPGHAERVVEGTPQQALTAAEQVLRRQRYRVRVDPADGARPGAVRAEGGRMRETGNLMFHTSLVLMIIFVAFGHMVGWRGDVIVPVGKSFTSTVTRYDTMDPGPWVNVSALNPFTLKINSLLATFEDNVPRNSPQWGQPREFVAKVDAALPGQKPQPRVIRENHALDIAGTEVYLLGNGYAPKVTVRDKNGNIIYDDETPFLPQGNTYKSTGAIKVTGASPKQLGFFGFFLPTASYSQTDGPISTFPGLKNPELVLGLYQGNLFPGDAPQSVYALNISDMKQVMGSDGQPLRIVLRPGQTVKLPHGLGSITLDSVPRWAGLSVRHDPGKIPALIFALLAMTGLIMSMTLRRRRIFVTARPEPDGDGAGRTLITIGGLSKSGDPRLQTGIDNLLESIAKRTGNT